MALPSGWVSYTELAARTGSHASASPDDGALPEWGHRPWPQRQPEQASWPSPRVPFSPRRSPSEDDRFTEPCSRYARRTPFTWSSLMTDGPDIAKRSMHLP